MGAEITNCTKIFYGILSKCSCDVSQLGPVDDHLYVPQVINWSVRNEFSQLVQYVQGQLKWESSQIITGVGRKPKHIQ